MKRLYIFYSDVEWSIFNRREFIINFSKIIEEEDHVLVINRPADLLTTLIKPQLNYFKIKEILNQATRVKKINDKLTLIRPFSILHEILTYKFHLSFLNRINAFVLKKQIRSSVDTDSFERIIFWSYEQIQWPFQRMFKNSFNVWEIFDDYRLKHDGSLRPIWIKQEKEKIRSTNLIFTLTTCLQEKYISFFPETYVMGNGFEPSLFSSSESVPKDLENIPTPRCCYLGNIRNWIDLKLTLEIIKFNVDTSFVFIGPIDPSALQYMAILTKEPNVYFLGKKKRGEIAKYMRNVEVGFIPYTVSEFTRCVRPIKIVEFLSSGTPVLTTVGADFKEDNRSVRFFEDAEEFTEKLNEILKEKNRDHCIKQSEQFTWNKIAENSLQIINRTISDV